jgi:hypothetical protein
MAIQSSFPRNVGHEIAMGWDKWSGVMGNWLWFITKCVVGSNVGKKNLVPKFDNLQKTCKQVKMQGCMPWMCCGPIFHVNKRPMCKEWTFMG